MALKMTDRVVDSVNVVDLEGRIVLGEESNAMRERVKSLLAQNKRNIVLNMANVTYIDSAGLGTLVASFHSARSQGATLKLVNLGAKFKEVLQVTKLLTVFEVFDSEAAAVRSFATTSGTIASAWSMSSSVDAYPSENRTDDSACSRGIPIASRTGEGWSASPVSASRAT